MRSLTSSSNATGFASRLFLSIKCFRKRKIFFFFDPIVKTNYSYISVAIKNGDDTVGTRLIGYHSSNVLTSLKFGKVSKQFVIFLPKIYKFNLTYSRAILKQNFNIKLSVSP